MSKIKKEDISEIYDLAWKQLREDRETVLNTLKEIRDVIDGNITGYATCGDNLVKLTEVMIKQTAQTIELIKVAQKDEAEAEKGLSAEDLDFIKKEIEQ
jgi:hypothetical protein